MPQQDPIKTELEELRAIVFVEFKQVHKLAPADYTENCTNVVMSCIERFAKKSDLMTRKNELEELKKHMISTSPFIDQILQPRLDEVENALSAINRKLEL